MKKQPNVSLKFENLLEAWLYARKHNIKCQPRRIGLREWVL